MLSFSLNTISSAVITGVLAANKWQNIRKLRWEVVVPMVLVATAITALIYAAQAKFAAPMRAKGRYVAELAAVLDLLDPRFKKCETLHLLAGTLSHQLERVRQEPLSCEEVPGYLDLHRTVLSLPSAAMALTMADTIETIRKFVTKVANDHCRDGIIYPADLAAEIRRAVDEACASRNFG